MDTGVSRSRGGKNGGYGERRNLARSQPRRDRPAGILEVHGLGRYRSPLCDERRRAEIVQPQPATRVESERSHGRTELCADQRQPDEFDTVDQILKSAKPKDVFYVPGEHDVLNDDGKQFLERYGKGSKGGGWYSFDKKGAHFIGLVNVMNLKAGGLGTLGHEQLEWLEDDVKQLKHSTPIVVFAHIPLWSVYPEWGWGTEDSAQALAYLKKFGSVTVLNGHIHQTMQKVEGNVTFHTAASTAFPQPQPGKADSPGPMKVPAEQLRSVLGITDVNYVRGQHALAVVDSSLA